jgi:hypothetical protein
MSIKPPSQPVSSRQAVDSAPSAGDDVADDALSVASSQDAVELLTKAVMRRGLSDIQRSSDKKNFAYTRLELAGQNIKNLDGDLATYPYVTRTISQSADRRLMRR